jgi:DNA-binding GntR family transcriptional regulator
VISSDILPRRSLRNDVFEILHKRIIAGEIRPGEWLRQEDIASQLGVSMTPVREALDQLVASGLAERELYRGVHVIELTSDEMVEAYGLRFLLEPPAAWQAAENSTPSQIMELKGILSGTYELVHLEDMSRLRELSRQFHAAIFSMCKSPLLERIYIVTANKFPDWMLYEAMFHHPDALAESLQLEQEQHRTILDAISKRNPQMASRASRDHIHTLGKDLEIYLNIPRALLQKQELLFSS